MRSIPHTFDLAEELEVYDATRENAEEPTFTRLVSLRSQVSAAYGAYASAASTSNLTTIIEPLGGVDAQALKSNYPKLRSGVRKDLGVKILKRSKKCLLCWHAPAGQLDHHLPKALFPEFAVLTHNLIPVCAYCNRTKTDSYQRADGGPSFLHAYRDLLPRDEQYLWAQISVGDTVAAEFRVVRSATMSEPVFATLEHHFDALDLRNIYGDLASELMAEKLTPVYEDFDAGGPNAVKRYLLKETRGAMRKHGVNHWKPVLLSALAFDATFCDGGFVVLGERDESVFEPWLEE